MEKEARLIYRCKLPECVQPFGGEGLSGTEPKAGGNASLMSLEEDDLVLVSRNNELNH